MNNAVKFKIVKNKGSINVITDESVYYAKGITNVRKLKGKTYSYKAPLAQRIEHFPSKERANGLNPLGST